MDTAERTTAAKTTTYDGFISYSHAADGLLAPRLQSALQRFAKPWWKGRAVRIFRDESSLSANPHLWSSITKALDESGWFVLLLSPDAAASPWVNQEIEYWKTHRDPTRILPVLTDGHFGWDGTDVTADAVPNALRGVFTEEPRWVDLRFAREEDQLELKNPRFSAAVADIASALRGIPKDELESEEVKQHRRTIRTALAGVALVGLLAVAAGVFAIQSGANAREAETQRIAAETEANRAEANAEAEAQARVEAENNAALAEARELAASAINNLDDDPELSMLLALEAISSVADDEIPIESRVALRQAIYSSHAVDRLEVNDIEPTGIMFADTSFEAGLHVVVDGARVVAYDTTTWEEAWRYEPATGDTLAQVRISPDGSSLAVSVVDSGSDLLPGGEPDGEPARVLILDGDGELVETIRYGPCPSLQAGSFSPDGSMLPIATGTTAECEGSDTSEWTMDLVDVETGETRRSLSTYPSPSDFGWSADSTRLLVSSWFGLGTRVIDILSGEVVAEVSDDAFFGSISPDGSLLAYGNFLNESVSIYDIEEGRGVNRLAGAADQVVSTTFSADSSRLIGSTRGTGTFVWDVESGNVLKSFPATPPTITSTFDADAQLLYHTGADIVTTWDLGDRTAGEFHSEHHGRISNANSFSTFGGIGTIAHVRPDLVITLFDAESGELLDENLAVDTFRDAAVLPDGRVVVVPRESVTVNGEELERSGPVSVWNPVTGDTEPIWGCVFLTTDPSECEDASGEAIRVTRMHTSPDGTSFAISDDAVFVIFDSTTLEVVTEGTLPDRSSLAEFGGDWLAYTGLLSGESGTNASITIFDVGSDEPVMEGAGSHQVETSHDGALLAIHDGSGRVAIHETESWEEMIVVGVGGSRIRGLAFSPDDSKLMTGGSDGFIRIWNLSNGEELERIPLGAVSDGYWIDDQHIAVDTAEGLWTVVTLDVAELQDFAMSRLTRAFTAQECDTYRIDPCPTLEEMRDR